MQSIWDQYYALCDVEYWRCKNKSYILVLQVYQSQGKWRNALYYFVVKEVKCCECVSFQVPIQIFVENIKDREAERRRGGIWNCFQTSINTYKPETNNLQSQVRPWLLYLLYTAACLCTHASYWSRLVLLSCSLWLIFCFCCFPHWSATATHELLCCWWTQLRI